MIAFLITLLVTAVSILIISKLPTGVEIDSFNKALISAFVFGILNAVLRPILSFISAPITFLTFGFFTIIINAIIFGLAAALVTGFRLRWSYLDRRSIIDNNWQFNSRSIYVNVY